MPTEWFGSVGGCFAKSSNCSANCLGESLVSHAKHETNATVTFGTTSVVTLG